jgi:eukaryotic-like serine/threonine-protein kinase
MAPERFQKIRALYDRVIDLPVAERETRLREWQVDDAMIAEVMAFMLTSEAKFAAHLAKPMQRLLGDLEPRLEERVGVWRLAREIGQGGMGTVYLVERSDGHFKQTAALKFLHGLPSADRLQLFARERQLLASLTHPNIAHLLDGGASDRGQPYLVMEYVDGSPIDAYCHTQHLNSYQILSLFSTACHAVAFAHRQLIVHCDLKPSNLLIDKEGRPVLLDFGISRLIDRVGAAERDPTSDAEPAPTSAGYTPRYASPEQREAGTVSTASDIYSLGVMLGELLDLAAPKDEELASIIAKATAADPVARYSTVDTLVEDLTRYTRREPLRAMPSTGRYIARKFLQRRWPMVLVGAAFIATVVGFTVKVVVESQRAIRAEQRALQERDRAQSAEAQAVNERDAKEAARTEALADRDRAQLAESRAVKERDAKEAARAEALRDRDRAKTAERTAVAEQQRATSAEVAARQTSDFLISVFDSSDPNAESGDIPASKLIAAAEARVEKQMQGQPATQAELYSTLGVVQSNMGRPKDARANLERALALERKLNRPLVLAEMLVRLHRVVSGTETAANSEAYAKEALALREQHAPRDSAELAESLAAMGRTVSELGRREEAGKLFTRAITILENKYPDTAQLSDTYALFGGHLNRNSEFEKGLSYYQRAIKINATLYGELHPKYLATYEWYAYTLSSLRRFDEAEIALRRALNLRKTLHGADNYLVALVMRGLAFLLHELDRPREAIPLLNDALPIVARSQGTQSMVYAVLLANLANANSNIGNYAVAEKVNAEALAIADKVSNKRPPPQLVRNQGRFQMHLGKLGEAGRSLFAAYEMRRALFGEKHNATIDSHLSIAEWHLRLDQLAEASARLDRVAALVATATPLDQISYDRHHAMIAAGERKIDAALAALEKIEQARFKLRGDKSALAWLGMIDRAEVLAKRGTLKDREQSAAIATQILAKISPTFDPDSPVMARLIQLQRQ